MTKRASILFFSLFLLPSALLADDISLERAQKAAEIFLTQGASLTRGATCRLTLVNYDEVAATRSDSKPAFYIFNRDGGGFVIISGTDAAKPVLGYSFENSFAPMDELPENLADWLDEYRSQINEHRSSGQLTTTEEAARWNALMSGTRSSVTKGGGKDLQTPDWGQGAPFNNKCPLNSSGKRTIVGCTNTAISEIMYYHKYPASGSGTLPTFTKNNITVPAITLGEKYQWSKMIAKYSGVSYTSEQADAVSTLCYHIAAMSQSSFGYSATSASALNAMPKLSQYFGYDNGFTTYQSLLFSYEGWRNLLKGCIDKGLPVLYTGYSNSGSGHAFVVDGYDDSGRILINFGWNASSNGYYEIGSFGNYIRSNRCWVNIQPENGGVDTGYMTLSKSGSYTGFAYQSGTPEPGKEINVKLGYLTWRSNGTSKFIGRINFKIYGRNGEEKGWARGTDITTSSSLSNGSSLYWESNIILTIPSTITIERGDYICILYKENSSSEWKKIKYDDSEISVNGKIFCHIADFTSMEYDTNSGDLIFRTFSNASYTLKNSGNIEVSTGVQYSNGVLTIDTTLLDSGKYTVSFTSGSQSTSISFII